MTDHPQSVALAARQPRQNNRCADKIGAKSHPPAGFGSQKFFSLIFLQTALPERMAAGFLPEYANLKD
ncbi:hypothetical protein [Pantoea ananatis]|uniref:hypothetical protein n=1 Tax=Pantoea ananas TaxID=553 RepID=UPI001303C974|nr:hypothetical protein [Pantoea ananatis]